MVTTNFLKMIGEILSNPEYTGDAKQSTFLDNTGSGINVGIVMPHNNDADVYTLLDRRMDEDSGMSATCFTNLQPDITPASVEASGSYAGLSVLSDCMVEYSNGTISLIYTVNVYNNDDRDLTVNSVILEKSTYNFEYDSGYSEWNHYKNTHDMIYSIVNLDEPVTVEASGNKAIIIKESVDANVE